MFLLLCPFYLDPIIDSSLRVPGYPIYSVTIKEWFVHVKTVHCQSKGYGHLSNLSFPVACQFLTCNSCMLP